MGEEYSVAYLYAELSAVKAQVAAIDATQKTNHEQNRRDIHGLRDALQTLVDLVTNLRIANARWSVGAGIITAIILKVIDHVAK
jgi:hypothetical protein